MKKLIATDDDKVEMLYSRVKAINPSDKINFINDRSAYGTDGKHMSKTEDNVFKNVVVYSMPAKGINYWYSNTTSNGHYGVCKLIMCAASANTLIDIDGEYGMTARTAGIVDIPDNLVRIQKVMRTDDFRKLKGYFTGSGQRSNDTAIIDNKGNMFKFIKEFKKDFWKEFYTDEMEQELKDEGVLDIDGNYIGK